MVMAIIMAMVMAMVIMKQNIVIIMVMGMFTVMDTLHIIIKNKLY